MTGRAPGTRGPILGIIAAVATVLAVTLVVAGGVAAPDTLFIALAAVFYVVPGLVVLIRRDWHLIGWLLLLTGLAFAGQIGLSNAYADGMMSFLDSAWVAWLVEGWLVNGVLSGVIALATMFPEGLRGRTLGHRLVGRITLVLAVATVAAAMLVREVGGGTQFPKLPNPIGLGILPNAVADVTAPIQVLLVGISLLGFWLRYRHTTGTERAQYRWVGFSFALVIVGVLVAIVAPLLGTNSDLPLLPLLIAIYLVPVSFSLAIIRYGLYEIDRIVSRTVTYATVALVVVLVYIVPVLALPRLLGESNDLVVAGSTLAAAAVFNPVRRRIQHAVDRRFDRARFDAEHQIDLFASGLRAQTDTTSIHRQLHTVVSTTLAPERTSLWIR